MIWCYCARFFISLVTMILLLFLIPFPLNSFWKVVSLVEWIIRKLLTFILLIKTSLNFTRNFFLELDFYIFFYRVRNLRSCKIRTGLRRNPEFEGSKIPTNSPSLFFSRLFKNQKVFLRVSWLIVIESPSGRFCFGKFQQKNLVDFFFSVVKKSFLIKNTKIL